MLIAAHVVAESDEECTAPPVCTIDRIDVGDMTPAVFKAQYHLQRPVIVQNVASQPDPTGWSTETLVRDHGDVEVTVGSSRTLIKQPRWSLVSGIHTSVF